MYREYTADPRAANHPSPSETFYHICQKPDYNPGMTWVRHIVLAHPDPSPVLGIAVGVSAEHRIARPSK